MPITRSLINDSIERAKAAFAGFGIQLPAFAGWTIDDWRDKGPEVDEIRDCMLGWDVTDFGSGDFHRIGRVLFTLRNGSTSDSRYPKSYAEKLLFDPEAQRAPAHFHARKREDICCRAGGNILAQLQGLTTDGAPSDEPLEVVVDGQRMQVKPRGIVRLNPGMSITIAPRTIHQFWAEEGCGIAVSSEVSSVCDDWSDNQFIGGAVRFPEIIEDAPRRHLLCHEYRKIGQDSHLATA